MTVAKTTMYFDGGCPVCRREVTHYRRLDRASRVTWVDIDLHRDVLAADGIGHREAMERLHVRDADGDLHTGIAGFLVLWDQLPAYRWLAATIRMLRLTTVLEQAYAVFARRRYRRRCTAGACAAGARTGTGDAEP